MELFAVAIHVLFGRLSFLFRWGRGTQRLDELALVINHSGSWFGVVTNKCAREALGRFLLPCFKVGAKDKDIGLIIVLKLSEESAVIAAVDHMPNVVKLVETKSA